MPATYEPIATTTLGSAAASITFSSISSAYTDLRLIIANYSTATGTQDLCLRFNSDSATNYSFTQITGDGSSASSGRGSNYNRAVVSPGSWSESLTTLSGMVIVDIFSYTGSTFKTLLASTSANQIAVGYAIYSANLWRSTSAINSITILNSGSVNIKASTSATLYGILKA